ncbi:hypothetical protein EYF80_023778 [Liparis tanakae]|uniref:Uncharacterized protein n=1 Tax=Liparis tanakae TaxID=230148 RepID=A0A4Z2HMK6_9TELE|nr:hypothetical protein EYF80_023778 [Liparis tanakae]
MPLASDRKPLPVAPVVTLSWTNSTDLEPIQTGFQPLHLLFEILPCRHVYFLQKPLLLQDVPPPLLQLGPGVGELLKRLHQVLFRKAKQVRVSQAADVSRAPVAHLAAADVQDADFSEAASRCQNGKLGGSVLPHHCQLAIFDYVHLFTHISLVVEPADDALLQHLAHVPELHVVFQCVHAALEACSGGVHIGDHGANIAHNGGKYQNTNLGQKYQSVPVDDHQDVQDQFTDAESVGVARPRLAALEELEQPRQAEQPVEAQERRVADPHHQVQEVGREDGADVTFTLQEPLWLNLLGGACMSLLAGPLKRSKKESGLSVSSAKLF